MQAKSKRDYSFLFTNIRSLIPKRDELSSAIDACSADVVVLAETWLHEHVDNKELLNCKKDYTIYRHDRIERKGGGILIAVSDEIASYDVSIAWHLEFLCVCIQINYADFLFCACYRPPNSSSTFCDEFHDCLNQVVVKFPKAPLFVLGDFNFPAISWNEPFPVTTSPSKECSSFIDVCSIFNLSQLVKGPTRITQSSSSTLDLLLTTVPESVSSLTLLPALSDHLVAHFTIPSSSSRPAKQFKQIRDYVKADFQAINRELEAFIDYFLPEFWERPLNVNWALFRNKVQWLTDKYIPLRRIPCPKRQPWYNVSLKRLLNKKSAFFAAVDYQVLLKGGRLMRASHQNIKKPFLVQKPSFISERSHPSYRLIPASSGALLIWADLKM